MTQDQYGQARDSGYVVGGQVVEDDETEEFAHDDDKPMTRFQKVASALRGDKPDQDQALPDQDEAAAVPGARQGDYWDVSNTRDPGHGQAADVTNPDVPVAATDADPLARQDSVAGDTAAGDTAAEDTAIEDTAIEDTAAQDTAASHETGDVPDPTKTQPDVFGNGVHPDSGITTPAETAPAVANTAVGDTAVGDTAVPDQDEADVTGQVDSAAPEAAGRHAGAPAQEELRPGEATGTLDDLGDLAYGRLIPDAADFTAQWREIQFKFVDDPHASVTEAADVVAQVTAKLEAAIAERLRAIEARQRAIAEQQRSLRGRWGDGAEADTETLRETLRMYRAFLDQLIGPKA